MTFAASKRQAMTHEEVMEFRANHPGRFSYRELLEKDPEAKKAIETFIKSCD